MPAGVVGAVDDRRGRLGDDLEAPGHERRRPRPRATAASSSGAVVGLGRGAREGEVALLDVALGEQLEPAVGGRDDELGAALGAHLLGQRHRVLGCRSAPTTSVPPGRTMSSFSAAMSAIVGPSQRVCSSPTFVRTCTFDGITFVASQRPPRPASTTATSAPCLGQLAVGGGGQGLELRDAVALLERAVDLLGRPRGARDGGARSAPADEVGVVDADALGERDEVRREVGAGAQAVAGEDRGRHPHRRGLAVRARRRGPSRSAPAASRARSSAGACGPGRSACRTARATAGSAPPPA